MKTILEIGGGLTPYFILYGIPLAPDTDYICLDVFERNLDIAKESYNATKDTPGAMYPRQVTFLLRDAIDLSFPDASVDEVVMSNVLSAPIHWNWNKDGARVRIANPSLVVDRVLVQDSREVDPFYRERKRVVDEALRVLRPGGTLSIYTDLVIYGLDSYFRIIDELAQDTRFVVTEDTMEADRIDEQNRKKLLDPKSNTYFRAEVLPKCTVVRVVKKQ
jgi:ubiquinone/menaquinone biosynthesis C-methylase UbiE